MQRQRTVADPGAVPARALTVPGGRIELRATGERCTVQFEGEIDIAFSRDEFAELAAAVRASGRPVDVDCSRVRFFSAEGFRMLVLLKSAAVDNRLAGLVTSPAVDRLSRALPMDRLSATG